ncbi:ABC transporter family substrate-binding protein [Streptomyces sp. NPDC005438]|uniref:ABC transporter family substrate-binding protein n=1 Tax=Streptomyces sp. NPDC005438 TaxID=3156880 RepID=UPI0033B77C93
MPAHAPEGGPRRRTLRAPGRLGTLGVLGVVVPLLVVPSLGGCTLDGDDRGAAGTVRASRDLPTAARGMVAEGGTVRWAVDQLPDTLNAFQPDANAATQRVVGATLPTLFPLDHRGRPERNPDYLRAAEVSSDGRTVTYELNPDARWSNGRRVGVADFRAQWRALNGRDNAFWTARNAGYDRIARVSQGEDTQQVKVTFAKPYADWRALFTPLYPSSVMTHPNAFNEGTRRQLPVTAGPFSVAKGNRSKLTLERDPDWWGDRAKLRRIELTAVPRGERQRALLAGRVDVTEVDAPLARRIRQATPGAGAGTVDGKSGDRDRGRDAAAEGNPPGPGAAGDAQEPASGKNPEGTDRAAAARRQAVAEQHAQESQRLRRYRVRTALDASYTQLALNGQSGPLADQRVRRAVARAVDRGALAKEALGPLGLPTTPLGSHLWMFSQEAYRDNSSALGEADLQSAQAALADAGWRGAEEVSQEAKGGRDDTEDSANKEGAAKRDRAAVPSEGRRMEAAGRPPVVLVRKPAGPLSLSTPLRAQRAALWQQAAHADARVADAAEGEGAAEARAETAEDSTRRARDARELATETRRLASGRAGAVRIKDGRPLSLRLLVPSGPGTESVRAESRRIARMLAGIGARTKIVPVKGQSYFKDHIASGDYDLALYSWPGTAYPATDAQPIFAKPEVEMDGSLTVDQNYTRVGTDRIDQLFEEAATEVDDDARADLIKRADARIWAAAGSIPLHQRPQLVAVQRKLANVGAFGFQTPRYQDIGYRKG